MRFFHRHHDNRFLKYGAPVIGLFFILAAFTILNTPIFFTYRSRANEEVVNTQKTQQNSSETIVLQADLPTCVNSFSYVPTHDKSLQSCFIQFTCNDSLRDTYFTSPHFSCSTSSNAVTCSENVALDKCTYIDGWIKGAAKTCGC